MNIALVTSNSTPRRNENICNIKCCAQMFRAALSTTAKQMNKEHVVYPDSGASLGDKRKWSVIYATTCINFENKYLS